MSKERLLSILSIFVSLFLVSTPSRANMVTADYYWVGNESGYSVQGTMVFDNSYPIIKAADDGFSYPTLSFFEVSVFDPSGALLQYRQNKVPEKAYSDYTWFAFSYDTAANTLVVGSFLDIGDDPGYYLAGVEGIGFSLIFASYPNDVPTIETVDGGTAGPQFIPDVPDSGSTLLITLAGFVVCYTVGRRWACADACGAAS